MSKVSERLAAEVAKCGFSSRELAIKTDIPKSAMQRYISGTTDRIPLSRLQKIADALNVSSAYLACWTDDPHFTVDEEKESSPVEPDELKILIDSLSDEKKKQLEQYAKFLLSQQD